jgi:hypothetical protein
MKKSVLVAIAVLFMSCSKEQTVMDQLYVEKVESLSDQQLIVELLIKTKGNDYQLSRILECSWYSIDRLKTGFTHLTSKSREKCKTLLLEVELQGDKVLIANDPYYKPWVRSCYYFVDNHFMKFMVSGGLLFFVVVLLLKLGSSDVISKFLSNILIMYFILILILYVTYFIYNLIFPYQMPQFLIEESINPLIEIV